MLKYKRCGPVYPIDATVLCRIIRDSRVLTRAEFAAKAGIDPTVLSHIFRGVRRHLRRDTLAQIYAFARQIGLDPSGLSAKYEKMEEKGGDNMAQNWEDLPLILTVPEVAAVLRCSRNAIYQEIKAGHLPALRSKNGRGGRIRVSKEALKRYLTASEQQSA